MCVAIAQKQGARTLTDEELIAGWLSNPDGGGYAYINQDNQIIEYHSMDFDDFSEKYKKDHREFGEQSPFLVHMRIATHGTVKLENTHPFRVQSQQGETVLIHNGIIHSMSEYTDDDTTDTEAFIKNVLQYLDDEWVDNEATVEAVDYLIGWSKLAILTTSPLTQFNLYIVNEDAKEAYWHDDIWFSNSSCLWDIPTSTAACTTATRAVGATGRDYVWDEVDAWIVENEDSLFYFSREKRAQASGDEWHKMVIDAIAKGAVCTYCMGIHDCYCDSLCHACFAPWYECDCMGKWVSIEEFREELNGDDEEDDLTKIANAHLETMKVEY